MSAAEWSGAPEDKPLSTKELIFVSHYCEHFNALEAARVAGFKGADNAIRQRGWELRQRKHIQKAIREFERDVCDAAGIRISKVLAEIAAIAFSNLADLEDQRFDGEVSYSLTGKSRRVTAAVASVHTEERRGSGIKVKKITMHPKLTALISLARHLGITADSTADPAMDGMSDEQRARAMMLKLLAMEASVVGNKPAADP